VTGVELLREKLEIRTVADSLFGENCYIVRRKDTKNAVVIDPGLQVDDVTRIVQREELSVAHILLTHGHIDHVAGVPLLQLSTGAPIAMHPDDRQILDWEQFARLPFLPSGFEPFSVQTELGKDSTLSFEDVGLRVLHTPGHTEGSVCFLFGLECFSGDTLFQRSIGRTDLPGGNSQKLVASIRTVLYSLPLKTVVHPGHGATTTVEEERLLNPFVPAITTR
jgi:hydroxyacylglutathione hydrolase